VILGLLATLVCLVLLGLGWLVRNESDNSNDDWIA